MNTIALVRRKPDAPLSSPAEARHYSRPAEPGHYMSTWCPALAGLALLLSACSSQQAATPSTRADKREPTRIALAVKDRSNSAASVAAFGNRVAVVWTASSASGSDIYMSVSTDDGATFGGPVRVNDVEGDARASGEQPARVVLDKTIHVVWPTRVNNHTVVRYARSTDDGRTFSKATTIAGDGFSGARGWESMAVGYDGGVHVVWLDGRNAAPHPHNHVHGQPMAKPAGGDGPRQDIFHTMWKGDVTPTETPVADNVCFCCKTAIATSGDRVYVAWRHIYPGSLRDIAVARSTDNGQTFGAPIRVSEDGWKLDACPDDGPAMAVDGHGGIHITWPAVVAGATPRKGIFYAALTDKNTFTPRLRLDSGDTDAAHPQLASDEHGTTAVVWDEHVKGARRIVLRRVSGTTAEPPQAFEGEGVNYPVVAATDHSWIVFWSAQSADGRTAIDGRRIPFH